MLSNFFIAIVLLSDGPFLVNSLKVAVFGGSGFVGRRISRQLIDAGCEVVSISRSGKPPSYYCDPDRGSGLQNWSDLVFWVSKDLNPNYTRDTEGMKWSFQSNDDNNIVLPKIDAAISCVGNVQPDERWLNFFGLGFDNEQLFFDNGKLNEIAIQMSRDAGAKRFVYISTSYEVSKMLEGPIPGYIDGKRYAEHVAYSIFECENDKNDEAVIVLGPSFVYGGKRFPKLGGLYRSLVESVFAKAYLGGNDALRKLSTMGIEDWVEKVIFSPPVTVDVVARVACAAALGLVNRPMVGARRQGFFDTNGKPVVYDNVVFVDGTKELERVDEIVKPSLSRFKEEQQQKQHEEQKEEFLSRPQTKCKHNKGQNYGTEPPFEGALIGKGPFLYPIPVVAFFGSILYLIVTNQLVNT